MESNYPGSNIWDMWSGLRTITDYKRKISSAEIISAFLPDELNTLCAHFENNFLAEEVQNAQDPYLLLLPKV